MKKAGRTLNRKRRMTLVFVLLFVVFLSVLDYPFVARLYNESRQNGAAVSFQEGETAVPDAEKEQMLQAARTQYGAAPSFSLELVILSGVLQWTYQIQLPLLPNAESAPAGHPPRPGA